MSKYVAPVLVFFFLLTANAASAKVLLLKSGGTVEGEVIEENESFVKVNIAGTPVTYFREELLDDKGSQPTENNQLTPAVFTDSKTQRGSFKVDGDVSEWKDVPVFIQETAGDIKSYTDVSDGSMNDLGEFVITGRSYQYDVTDVKLSSDSDNVYILIELADDLNNYFQKNKEASFRGGNICVFYLDLDNRPDTGETEQITKLGGFEKSLSVVVSTTLGFNYSISYWLDALPFDFSKRYEKNSKKDSDFIAIENNYIELRIPKRILGVSSGQTIRVVFRESGAALSPEGFSEETVKTIH